MLSFWVAVATAAKTAAGPAHELATLLEHHGYALPLPPGYGWDAHPALAIAVNALYAYTPTPKSPPVLRAAETLASNAIIHCSRRACTANEQKLETSSDDEIVTAAIEQLVVYHGHPVVQSEKALAAETFAAFDTPSYACETDAVCARFGSEYACCTAGKTVPGKCCSREDLNQYDAPVSMAVIIVFLSCAGIVLLWVVFQKQFRSIAFRLLQW